MNNPLSSSFGNFKHRSEKNRAEDEKTILDRRASFCPGGNKIPFPTKVYVIHRTEREDRWSRFESQNRQIFDSFEVIVWEASVPGGEIQTVTDAIFDSFLSCIKNSQDESIIVMEDDAYLAEGGMEKIRSAWEHLPEDWDILIGNHYFFSEIEVLSDHLSKPVGRASTSNFFISRRTIIPKIEENLDKRGIPSLRDFDHFITSELIPINNFTVWPMVSREFPSFSDHRSKNLDSSIKLRENAHKYLFVDQEEYYSSLEGW
jgi:hypothetical protein